MKSLPLVLALMAVIGCAEDWAAVSAHASRLVEACWAPIRARSCPQGSAAEKDLCMERVGAELAAAGRAAAQREMAMRAGCPERLAGREP